VHPVEIALALLGLYLLVGLVFAIAFVTKGVRRVDGAAEGSPWSFRLLILPGAAALWPVLLRRWLASGHAGDGAEGGEHG